MHYRTRILFVILIVVFVFFLISCGGGEGIQYYEVEQTVTFDGGNYGAYQIQKSGDIDLTCTLQLGSNVKDVYFIVTNTHPENNIIIPAIDGTSGRSAGENFSDESLFVPGDLPGALRGSPEISKGNREFLKSMGEVESPSARPPTARSVPYSRSVGDTALFNTIYDASKNEWRASVSAKLMTDYGTETTSGKKLEIWVAEDCLSGSGSGKSFFIDNTTTTGSENPVLDRVAEKFLQAGSDNDIYDWVTTVFGEEWGSDASQKSSNLISDNDTITILFYDIDDDDTAFLSDGAVAGFFTPVHSFVDATGGVSGSNERVMFFMDAVMLAFDDDDGQQWSISDAWPSEIISTLAHEFQHMIHYYQKYVLQGPAEYTEPWLDELLSMATEDLVSHKLCTVSPALAILGPRGIIGADLSAGTSTVNTGRLPFYVPNNNMSLMAFDYDSGSPYIFIQYAVSYSLGAFLIRNYNGADILGNIVQNPYHDYRAVAAALGAGDVNAIEGINTFGAALRLWGVAELLSEFEIPTGSTAKFILNGGDAGIPTTDFTLGSINMFNYSASMGGTSTFKYFSLPFPETQLPRGSHHYILAGKNLTGDQQWRIKLPRYVHLDVVVK